MNELRIYSAGITTERAPDGSRVVGFKDEAIEFRGANCPIASIAVKTAPVGTPPDIVGMLVTPHVLGLHSLDITFTTGAVVNANIFACDRTALDGIPDMQRSGSSSPRTTEEKIGMLQAIANGAAWFTGSRASMFNHSLTEFGG